MKLNINKCFYLMLLAVSIGLCIFLFAISLLTKYTWLQYTSIILVYIQSMFAVKSIHKYPLWIKK